METFREFFLREVFFTFLFKMQTRLNMKILIAIRY